MVFAVTKTSPPELVVPSAPTPGGDLPLTSTDKSRLFLSYASFHVFDRPIHEPAATVRRALSQALVHYYPFAGRMEARDDGDVQLACTGEGATFASAMASCTLRDAGLPDAPPATELAGLALWYGGRCRVSDPLLMMQVTEFSCGGYVVGVTWNHGVADGVGLSQLLRAVGELARGLAAPSVAAIRYDESLPDMKQLFTALQRSPSPAAGLKLADFAYSDVTVQRSFVSRVKAEFRRHHAGGQPCTAFEAASAAIWQCRTRAINAGPGALSPLVFVADVRRLVGAKAGYYGNCITSVVVTATSGAVAGGAVVDLVKLIKDAKERVGRDALLSQEEPALDDDLVGALRGYNALYLSSWGGIGMDGVDFGGGTPARVLPSLEQVVGPSGFPCLPCSGKDGGDGANVVAFCVREEHAEDFHAQVARLQ